MFIKRIIITVLRSIGYDLVKVNPTVFVHAPFNIGKFNLEYPQDHEFPNNYTWFPQYQRNLARIASFLFSKFDNFSIIDIGANIGDSTLIIRDVINCPILCVEGEDKYVEYLIKNTQMINEVVIYHGFLSDVENQSTSIEKNYERGTMRFTRLASKNKIVFKTLDDILINYPKYSSAKFVKIDTDGYDNKIIRGGRKFLRSVKPVLFFEYDKEFLQQNGDNSKDIFEFLKELGYDKLLFYDNYGRLIITTDVENTQTIFELDRYITKSQSAFQYYDICAFHKQDEKIALEFYNKELALL